MTHANAVRKALTVLPEGAAVAGFIVVIWVSLAMLLSQQYTAAELSAVRDTGNLARAYEENAERIVAAVDQILLAMRSHYAANPRAADLLAWQRRQMRPDRLTVQPGFITRDGFASGFAMGGVVAGRTDVSDGEFYRFHLDPGRDDLFIGKPVVGRGTGTWMVQFTRKLLLADGSFAGVALVSMDCQELSGFYGSLEPGQGTVVLAGTDGIVRARGPWLGGAIGVDLGRTFSDALAGPNREGHFWSTNRFDGVERVASFRRLRNLPLVVMVGLDEAQVFDTYRHARARSILIGGIATGIVLLFGGLWITLRRRWITSKRLLRLALENISQGIVMVDANGRTPVMNGRAIELLGHPDEVRQLLPTHGRSAGPGAFTRLVHKDDKIIEVENRPTSFGGVVATCTDVTERQLAEAHINHLARHDVLTGLPNRLLLLERMTEALERVQREGGHLALLCLDLDDFKVVNDTIGQNAGDLVLSRFAERLGSLVRPGDTVARTGGDEFAILARNLPGPDMAEEIARRLLDELPVPVDPGGYVSTVRSSIGFAVYPDDGADGRALVKNADNALHRAKAEGKGGFRRFEASMDRSMRERQTLERELRQAVEQDALETHFQPQFAADALRVVGFEALVRWPHPTRGYVPPGVFLPLAEKCGLLVPIERRVLEQACRLAAMWQPACRLAVNLSPAQFADDGLMAQVSRALARAGLPAGLLELEVTEGVLIKDSELALGILRGLKELGVTIALDDFGTGYSSLSYLRSFPVDRIKIDKSFVCAQEQDFGARAIVEAVLAMGSRMDLGVTAEGVESERQLALLREQGCAELQGFLLGRPMPANEVQGFLDARADPARRGHLKLVSPEAGAGEGERAA